MAGKQSNATGIGESRMGTEIATGRSLPTATPELTKSLSRQEVEGHRARIAFEVKTVLSAYFQPHEDDAIKAGQLAWWCDELEDWEQEQVVWALRKWNREEPRKRPTPGDILSILKAQRGKAEAAKRPAPTPEPERTPATAEEATAALKAAGLRIDECGRVVS
jgi:hypothetical protein